MMKKLIAEEKKDQENPERKSENRNEILLYSKSFFASTTIPPIELIASQKMPSQSDGNPIDFSFDIFHPPKV